MIPRITQYAEEAATKYNTTAKDILSRSRYKEHVKGRHEVWRRLRADGFSYPWLAMTFGCDTSTVQSAIKGRRRNVR